MVGVDALDPDHLDQDVVGSGRVGLEAVDQVAVERAPGSVGDDRAPPRTGYRLGSCGLQLLGYELRGRRGR
ncbi:hypothetical protein GCM10018790_41160 [Kitasatospora xanthocidica]|nr:hypothetical protein GCM10018790_41160 [Kitasatospora xanthocidica]